MEPVRRPPIRLMTRWVLGPLIAAVWAVWAFGAGLGSLLGQELTKFGYPDAAIAVYRATLRINSRNGVALMELGVLLEGKGRAEEAVGFLRRALAESPQSPRMHALLGRALLHAGRIDEAIREFREAVLLPSRDGYYQRDLDMALRFRETHPEVHHALPSPPP